MIGARYVVPTSICDSGVVQVFGQEDAERNWREKVKGDVLYWCREVVDGRPRGTPFAIGSDELESYTLLASETKPSFMELMAVLSGLDESQHRDEVLASGWTPEEYREAFHRFKSDLTGID